MEFASSYSWCSRSWFSALHSSTKMLWVLNCFIIRFATAICLRINFTINSINLQAKDETRNFLESTIKEYRSSGKEADAVSLMWNQLQARFECCGVNSYNDFDRSEKWLANRSSRVVPESCCKLIDKLVIKLEDNNCPYAPTDRNSYYMKVRWFYL